MRLNSSINGCPIGGVVVFTQLAAHTPQVVSTQAVGGQKPDAPGLMQVLNEIKNELLDIAAPIVGEVVDKALDAFDKTARGVAAAVIDFIDDAVARGAQAVLDR